MKILLVHNFYRQKGGEFSVFNNENDLLKSHSHDVFTYTRNNNINNLFMAYEFLFNSTWSEKTYKEIYSIVKDKGINIVHVHNFFPLISPSVFYAAKDAGANTVFTLHNYRIIDPGALLFNKGVIEESPIYNFDIFRTAFQRRYRDSFLQTLRVSKMIEYHWRRQTWDNKVDSFITLTSFAKSKFSEIGLPKDKLVIKPNFLKDPFKEYPFLKELDRLESFVYVGRISKEKGVNILVNAWKKLPESIVLFVLGDGPYKKKLQEETKNLDNIKWFGYQPEVEVYKRIKQSNALLMPSICFEGFPVTILEAFSLGTPVITSDIGGQASIIKNNITGNVFRSNDPKSLAKLVLRYIRNPNSFKEFGFNARQEYLDNYTPKKNYEKLLEIYGNAISN